MEMKLEVFKETINRLKEQNESIDRAYKAGIDLINFLDPIESAVSHLIGSIYGIEGKEVFDWWCYEKEWGTRKDFNMTDREGNVMCETIEDLHTWLEENASNDYILPRRLSDEEREEAIKIAFGFGA